MFCSFTIISQLPNIGEYAFSRICIEAHTTYLTSQQPRKLFKRREIYHFIYVIKKHAVMYDVAHNIKSNIYVSDCSNDAQYCPNVTPINF